MYNNVNGLYPAIWGRKLPVSGHPIYIMAKAYTDMVRICNLALRSPQKRPILVDHKNCKHLS